MDIATPLAASTAIRLGGAALSTVKQTLGNFADVLAADDATATESTKATEASEADATAIGELLQQASERMQQLAEIFGARASLPDKISAQDGKIVPTAELDDSLERLFNEDPALGSILKKLSARESQSVIEIPSPEARLTADALPANMISGYGGYPNW